MLHLMLSCVAHTILGELQSDIIVQRKPKLHEIAVLSQLQNTVHIRFESRNARFLGDGLDAEFIEIDIFLVEFGQPEIQTRRESPEHFVALSQNWCSNHGGRVEEREYVSDDAVGETAESIKIVFFSGSFLILSWILASGLHIWGGVVINQLERWLGMESVMGIEGKNLGDWRLLNKWGFAIGRERDWSEFWWMGICRGFYNLASPNFRKMRNYIKYLI